MLGLSGGDLVLGFFDGLWKFLVLDNGETRYTHLRLVGFAVACFFCLCWVAARAGWVDYPQSEACTARFYCSHQLPGPLNNSGLC